MRESGSKRPAASSPTRRVKRHRKIELDNESPESDSKKVKEKNVKVKIDEGITKKNSKRKDTAKNASDGDDGKSKSKRSSDKREKASSESDSKRYSSDEAELDQKPSKGSRYWGGDEEKPNLEDGELSSHSNDPVDFEVGQRYYTSVAEDKDKEKNGNETEAEFLVGKRYYEDEPDKPSNQTKNEGGKGEGNTTKLETAPTRRAKLDDPLLSRTGGAYIPPAKLRLLQASITDKSSVSYQRIAWEALKKSIHGHINKVNTSNIGIIARLLMKENIVRGRGLLSRSLLQAQAASPTFTNVYACLVSIINSKFPNIGELLMKRVILQFKRGFKRNDKALCISSCQFIAHLVNQQVAHEIVALEMLTLLLESPTDDSVEVAVAFLKEVGQKLLELSPKGTNAIFDMLRNILHQGNLEKRVQYMIEVVFQVRKDGFRSFESIAENLDLVEEEDRFTHILTLDEAVDPEDMLNVFKHDTEYEINENKYKALKEEIIGESSSEEESGDEGSDEDSEEEGSEDDEDDGEAKETKEVTIKDATETNLVALRRTIYLTIQSSLDFEECCHKLLKMDIKPGQEPELCHMLLDCCAELRTYEKFFGLLAQRFCQINRVYIAPLEEMFAGSYATVHRLDTNKLRNVARFFGHLLFTDAISWTVLETVKLNEEDTTSSSRIFIKILFQELAEYLGLAVLNQRLKDPTLQSAMEGLFPRDNPKNTRFAINFFTSIGLGGLTDDLREHLKTQPKPSAVAQLVEKLELSSDSSSSSSDSSDDSSDSDSTDESSDSEDDKKKKKKTVKEKRPTKKNSVEQDNTSKTDRNNKNNRDKRTMKSSETEEQGRKGGSKDERINKHGTTKEDKSREKEHEKKARDKPRERERYDRESDHNSNRDKVNYERENYKNSYKEKHEKNMGRQDYRRNDDRNKRYKEETTVKTRDHKEDSDKYRDKENRKKECKKKDDLDRERDRRSENKYRQENPRKYIDDDGMKKRKDDYESSRQHKERSHRKHK